MAAITVAAVVAGAAWLAQPAQAHRDVAGCDRLAAPDGLTWTREAIPPRPVEGRANRAFVRSGLWQFIVRGAAAEGMTPAEAAQAEGLTLFGLMEAAYGGWREVDAMTSTDVGLGGAELPARVGDRTICWRPLTAAEADLDGEPGGESAPAWYAWFSNNPARR
jgi:hypothetical protein